MFDLRLRYALALSVLPAVASVLAPAITRLEAQAPAAARQLGTVSAISGNAVTLKTAAGAEVTVNVAPDAPVLALPPGSTDLKAATPAKLEDVSVGDRILATGTNDASDKLVASRVVLMKSTDIAARNSTEQREWQRNGLGGLVRSVDGPVVTVVAGAKVLKINTTPTTTFKRYADDSVAFADVKPGKLQEIHAGDQLRARGTVADDRLSLAADQVVYGAFENLSGIVSAVDQSALTLTLKDTATKKVVTVFVTQKSDLRKLSPEASARFTARNSNGGVAGAGGRGEGQGRASGTAGSGGQGGAQAGAQAGSQAGAQAVAGSESGLRPRSAGMDLSQMLSRLPTQPLSDLHAGEAVMIVASREANANLTAITLLSGVEQILSATPSGSAPITLSPWNIGGAPEGGGEGGR